MNKEELLKDYYDLIELRNRLHDSTDNDIVIYEEDHITLDRILDYMEYFIKGVKNESKN